MREKQPAEAAGSDLAAEVRIVNLTPDAIAPFFRRGLEVFIISSRGGLCRFFKSRTRELREIIRTSSRTRRMQHTRSEVRDGVFDHAGVKAVDGPVAFAGTGDCVNWRMPIEPLRQSLAGMMQKPGSLFGSVHHLKVPNAKSVQLRQIRAAAILDGA